VARSGVKTAVSTEAAAELERQLSGLAGASPITTAEFDAARETRLRGLAQGYETLNRVADRLLETWGCGRPVTDLATESERLAAVGLEAGNRLARQFARPGSPTLLVVGDAPKLKEGLQKLGLGPVVELDPLGKPLARAR
jgi:predicted Zn-dependent peptidase